MWYQKYDITFRCESRLESKEAVSIIQEMENRNLNIEFIEQPVHAKDWDGLKYVKDRANANYGR